MKPKHTPGPWEVTEALDGTLQPFQAETGRHLLNCEGGRPFSRRVREYNAALIAQAPELLRCLKEALQYVPQDGDTERDLHEAAEITIYKAEHP